MPPNVFREILDSLQPYPQMQFLLFTEAWGELERTLLEFCEEREHSILLYMLEGFPEEKLPEGAPVRRRPYRREQPRYNLQGKLYNHAFVTGPIPDAPEEFARKVYTGIANAGGLYLLLREEGEIRRWEEALVASNYVATSTIDLGKGERFLNGRKMHGWGG
ncbi:hypothetical protein [Nitratifractor sp.]